MLSIIIEAGFNFLKNNNDLQVLYDIIAKTGIKNTLPEVTERERDHALHIMPENSKEAQKEEVTQNKDENTLNF